MADPLIPAACPEIELLLRCIRPTLDTANRTRIMHLAQPALDWEQLLELATHHHVKSLVYWRLNEIDCTTAPEAIFTQLGDDFLQNSRRNIFLMRKLLDIQDLFAAHAIMVVPFKGPVLAATVYNNLSLRHTGDLDIIVYPHDVDRASALLVAQGYRPIGAEERPLQSVDLDTCYHTHFVGNSVHIELHWGLTDPIHAIPMTLATFASQLTPVCVAGKFVLVFAPDYLLVLLCLHGMKHYWERLSWLADVAWLLAETPNLDWTQVLRYSDQFHIRRMLLLGVYLAHHLLGASLPTAIMDHIRADRFILPLTAQLADRMFSTLRRPSGLKRDTLYLIARERRRDKAIYLAHRLCRFLQFSITPNDHDFDVVPLPPVLQGLYYAIRPVRVLYDHRRLLSQAYRWGDR